MQERPKILTRFTLSSALTLKLYIDNAGSFDQSVSVTVPAGSYYNAWDGQSDDFLYVLADAIYDALVASGNPIYEDPSASGKLFFELTSANKVKISVGIIEADVRIAWTEDDGAAVAAILGFNSAANLDLTTANGWTATGTWQHAYGWYADEDGQMPSLKYVDDESANALQSVAISGHVKTQYLDSRYSNALSLAFLSRDITYSDGVGYATAPVDPAEKNIPLECWWHEARQGIEFRVYRANYQQDTTKAEVIGASTSANTTTLTDSGKSFDTDPQAHKGKLLLVIVQGVPPRRFFVTSHTATVITIPNALLNEAIDADTYAILDHRYRTYVVDIQRMAQFAPVELPNIVRFDITIPLLRYES
jgi:hypothetical protein